MENVLFRYRGIKVIRGPDVIDPVPEELMLEIQKYIDQRLSMAALLTRLNYRYEMLLMDPADIPAGCQHFKIQLIDCHGNLFIDPSVEFEYYRHYDYDAEWAYDTYLEPVLVFLYEGELDFLM